jgi:hypothetical protein
MRRYQTKKYTKAQGEHILWHVLGHLQYDQPGTSEGYPETWLAIQQIKQLLGVSVA